MLKEVQSRLEMRKDELIAMRDAQTNVPAVLEQLRTQTANKTSNSVELHSAARDDERTAKCAHFSRCSKNSVGAPTTVIYPSLLTGRDELFKNRSKALMPENQWVR